MYHFKMPSCSHLIHLLHPDGERRVLPSSPLTTQFVPHLPSLVSLLYLTPNTSPLCFSPTSLPHTIFSRAALVPAAEQRHRGVPPVPEAPSSRVGWLGAHRQATKSCCPLQARGVRERNRAATRKPLFLCRVPRMISSSNALRSQENYMLHIQNSLCESPGEASSRRDVLGYHLPSAGAAEGVSGPKGPCQSLKHPTFGKDAPQRGNPILCQALSSLKPTGSRGANFEAQDVGWYATTQIKCHLSWQSLCPLHSYSSRGLSSGHGQVSNEKT